MCAEDSNDNIITLGVAFFYDNESSHTWSLFLSFMKEVYPSLNHGKSLFIADGEKGFKEVFKLVFPLAHRLFCMKHMLNPDKHVTAKDKALYKEAAGSANVDQIYQAFSQISESQRLKWEKAGINIVEMFPGLIPDISWGKTTSSCIESLNNAYVPIRYLHSVDALVETINRETRKMASNKSVAMACVDTIPPRSGRGHLSTLMANSNRMANVSQVKTTNNQYLWSVVTSLEDNKFSNHVCTIKDTYCSCKKPQMTRKPCWHKVRTGIEVSMPGDAVFGSYFTTAWWQNQYVDLPGVMPLSTSDWSFKKEGDVIMPFAAKRGRGRPKDYARLKGRQEIFANVAKARGKTMGQVTQSKNGNTMVSKKL